MDDPRYDLVKNAVSEIIRTDRYCGWAYEEMTDWLLVEVSDTCSLSVAERTGLTHDSLMEFISKLRAEVSPA